MATVKSKKTNTQTQTSNAIDVPSDTSLEPTKFEEPVVTGQEEQVTITNPEVATQQPTGDVSVYKVKSEIDSYAASMDPKQPIVPADGGKLQYHLYTVIKSIFDAATQEEFNNEFNTLLKSVKEYKDAAFSENFVYRFPEHWAGSPAEFNFHRRMLHFIIQTADVSTRAANVKNIDMGLVTLGLTEEQKGKLFTFYQL